MAEHDIKLIALDMDGTVLNDKGEISKENQEAIRQAERAGIKVLFSTGRTRMLASDYAKTLNLSSYMITVNGSEIWDGEGNLVERSLLHSAEMEWMWNLAKEYSVPFWAISCDKRWDNEMPDDIASLEWMKCRFEIEDADIRTQITEALHKRGGLEISNSSPSNLEVNALGINKAKAIGKVCALLNLNMNQVMAVGDSLNDLAMIRQAGLGIAMGNAQETVKEAADWITSTNNEHGVAKEIGRAHV